MKDEYSLPGAPGKYMSLRPDKPFGRAYFADSLPPRFDQFDLSDEVINELADAMHALGRLDGLATEVDNPGAVFSSFVYKEAESSSQVEGTAVTVSDIYQHKIEYKETSPPETEHEKDVREARNYIRALDEATEYLKVAGSSRESITLKLIKNLHETLMEEGRTDDDNPLPGEFRPSLVAIRETNEAGFTETRFVPPKPDAAESYMEDLEEYIQSSSRFPSLIDIALIHYQFETIHPFKDGNGRVGRLLIVLLLACCDLLNYPLLYPSSYFNRSRDEYADRLLNVSEEGEWREWVLFFLRGIREQSTEAFVRARRLLEKRREYEEEYADAPESVQRLVDSLFSEPYFSVKEAAETIDMTYPSAKNAVDQLEEDGVVTELTGKQKYRVFEASEVMDIVEKSANQLPEPKEIADETSSLNFPR